MSKYKTVRRINGGIFLSGCGVFLMMSKFVTILLKWSKNDGDALTRNK